MTESLFISPCVFWKIEESYFQTGAESPTFNSCKIKWKMKFKPALCYGWKQVDLMILDIPVNYPEISFTVICSWETAEESKFRRETKITTLEKNKWFEIWCFDKGSYELIGHQMYFACICKPYLQNEKLYELQEKHYPTLSLPCAESLAKDFEAALYNPEYSDVVVVCGDESFSLHKSVLSSRSDVFQAMFRNDLKETLEGKVNIILENAHAIPDEPSVFKQLIHYIYTGIFIGTSVDSVLDLYKAAHKYNIVSLKQRCIDFILENLEDRIACEVLVLADTYNEIDLKNNVMKYLIKRRDILLSEEWQQFSKDNRTLAYDVLFLYVQKVQEKRD